jgi:hypothetical protein
MDAWHEREAEAEKHGQLKPGTTERVGVGLSVEATELAHRFLQPLGLVRTARHEISCQTRDTRHPVGGFGSKRGM